MHVLFEKVKVQRFPERKKVDNQTASKFSEIVKVPFKQEIY